MSEQPILKIEGISLESIKPSPKDPSHFRAEKLFHDIQAMAEQGEIVLLLGPSGSGKSLLTNLLLGFISPLDSSLFISCKTQQGQFKFHLDGKEIDVLSQVYPSALEGKIGIMFQSLGLFEDLNVEENLGFANDQSDRPKKGQAWRVWKKEIVETLGFFPNILTCDLTKLSGGQRQRVAFGKLLAFSPRIMIFDEPTSALDFKSAQQVVNLIHTTHLENKNLLTLIITHHYEHFLGIANRVWFINSHQQIENHYPPRSADYYEEDLSKERKPASREISAKEFIEHEAQCKDGWWNTVFHRFFRTFRKLFRVQSYLWFLKFFWVMFKLVVVRSIPYNLMTGFFLGLVATYFSLHLDLGAVDLSSGGRVRIESFVIPAFFREMLTGFGVVMFRALIPLFTCIFIAARSGTAVTAYLSNMRDSERRQWDAMRNLGVEPNLFFFPQGLICFVFGCWFLSYFSFLMSALGSLLIALATNPLCTWYTWMETFWANLRPTLFLGFIPIFEGFGMFTVKTMCAGAAIAVISFVWGVKPRKNSIDILRHLTGANIWNMLAILIIFFVLLIMELG